MFGAAQDFISIVLFGEISEAGKLSAAQVVDLNEACLDAVKERPEVYNAGGHDTEALDDLSANDYWPGGVDGVGGMRGAIDVRYLGDDGCDDTDDGFSDNSWKKARWRYIRRAIKKTSIFVFFRVATLSRRTIIEGRMTSMISVRPLTMATKYAQDVCKGFLSSGMSRR